MRWHANKLSSTETQQAAAELKILALEVATAYKFWRKKYLSPDKGSTPLYLLLGPPRFGKTTLLAQSGLELHTINAQPLSSAVVPTKYCTFWFSATTIYVDTAGIYTKPEVAQPRNELIWQGFIKLLQKYFGRQAISGALLILDLPAIAQDPTLRQTTLLSLKERIYTLATVCKKLSLHIIFTKCDRLLGFPEFFARLNQHERSQPFGLIFTEPAEQRAPIHPVTVKFTQLFHQLNQRVVPYLHQAQTARERQLLKIFPLQFHTLEPLLLEVVGQIPTSYHLLLSGIYFTSSKQAGAPLDLVAPLVVQALQTPVIPSYAPEASGNQSYFIATLFKNINALSKQSKKLKSFWSHIVSHYQLALVTLATIIVLLGVSGGAYYNYQKNSTLLHRLATLLQLPEAATNSANLHNIITTLEPPASSWWLKIGGNEVNPLLKQLRQLHRTTFTKTLITELEHAINTELTTEQYITNPRPLYDSLQIYLMLGNTKKLQPLFVKTWFHHHWHTKYRNDAGQYTILMAQVTKVLANPANVKLDDQLIATARAKLIEIPLVQLLYLLLESKYGNHYVTIAPKFPPLRALYTKRYFTSFYYKVIPQLRAYLPKTNWVLGKKLPLAELAITPATITTLQKLYEEKYIVAWETLFTYLPSLELSKDNTLKPALAALATISGPIIKLLQQLSDNSNIPLAPEEFKATFTTKLHGLNKIALGELQQQLAALTALGATITNSSAPYKEAFTALSSYLKQQSNNPLVSSKTYALTQAPLLQHWFEQIIEQICGALLRLIPPYIEQVWHTTIFPAYQTMIENKYPIFKESIVEITLADFNKFFAPHGLLDNFFTTYLEPFIVTSPNNWQWRDFSGDHLGLAPELLETMLRAQLLQKMFYSLQTTHPSIQFTLTPLGMTTNTQNFTLHLDGQTVTTTPTSGESYSLSWPGPRPGLVVLDFNGINGKYLNSSKFGTWAWFRILERAELIATTTTKQYILIFALADYAVKYALRTQAALNPFALEILHDFRCPAQIRTAVAK